jgi:hypothetical protein
MPTIAVYVTEKEYKELVALGIHEKKEVSELLQSLVKKHLVEEGVTE